MTWEGKVIRYARRPNGSSADGEPYVPGAAGQRGWPLHPEWNLGQYDILERERPTHCQCPMHERGCFGQLENPDHELCEWCYARAASDCAPGPSDAPPSPSLLEDPGTAEAEDVGAKFQCPDHGPSARGCGCPLCYETAHAPQADAVKTTLDAFARIDDRKLACSITSVSAKLACAGNDGGEHDDVCDLVTEAVGRVRQELLRQLRSGRAPRPDAPAAADETSTHAQARQPATVTG